MSSLRDRAPAVLTDSGETEATGTRKGRTFMTAGLAGLAVTGAINFHASAAQQTATLGPASLVMNGKYCQMDIDGPSALQAGDQLNMVDADKTSTPPKMFAIEGAGEMVFANNSGVVAWTAHDRTEFTRHGAPVEAQQQALFEKLRAKVAAKCETAKSNSETKGDSRM